MRGNRTRRYFTRFIHHLPQLTEREKEVLVRRLSSATLQKVGENYRVTEARVRQIEKKALKKVKSKNYQQKLF